MEDMGSGTEFFCRLREIFDREMKAYLVEGGDPLVVLGTLSTLMCHVLACLGTDENTERSVFEKMKEQTEFLKHALKEERAKNG